MDVKGKAVLVTGASYGIGEVTARLFGKEGAKVALAARSKDLLEKISADIPDSLVVQADITVPDQVRRMVADTFKHYGRLDVLINNAGEGLHVPVEMVNMEDFAYVMSLNVYGPVIAMQAAIPIMKKQGGGMIVNVSSKVTMMNIPTLAPYAATKAALNMLSLTARTELADSGIVVSVVYPGLTATGFQDHMRSRKRPSNLPRGPMPQADPPEKVAQKILEAVKTGAAETVL